MPLLVSVEGKIVAVVRVRNLKIFQQGLRAKIEIFLETRYNVPNFLFLFKITSKSI